MEMKFPVGQSSFLSEFIPAAGAGRHCPLFQVPSLRARCADASTWLGTLSGQNCQRLEPPSTAFPGHWSGVAGTSSSPHNGCWHYKLRISLMFHHASSALIILINYQDILRFESLDFIIWILN